MGFYGESATDNQMNTARCKAGLFCVRAMTRPRDDRRSDEAQLYRRWYKTARWKKRRAAHLAQEPFCRMCKAAGHLNDGSRKPDGSPQPDRRRRFLVADHIQPHRGDQWQFFNGKLQTLCPDHHDSQKQAEERRGFVCDAGDDGWPIDPKHPANR